MKDHQLVLQFPAPESARAETAWTTIGAPAFVAGRRDTCVVFDGQSSLEMPLDPKRLGDTFTVECWVKPHTLARPEPQTWAAPWRIAGLAVFERTIGSFNFRLQCFGKIQGNEHYPLWWPGRGFLNARLEPDHWYHVAAVFTPRETGWYVNGIPVEVVGEGQDLTVPEGVLRLGKDFEGCIEGFRIWRGALASSDFDVPEVERQDAFSRLARLKVEPRTRTADRLLYEIGLERLYVETAPADLQEITVALCAEPLEGLRTEGRELGSIVLKRAAGFRAVVELTKLLDPGLYLVTCKPTARLKQATPLTPKMFAVHVPVPVIRATPLKRTHAAPVPALGTQVVLLNGPDWKIAIDPKNEGHEQGWWKGPRPGAKPTKVPWVIQERFPGYHGVAWYWRTFAAPRQPHRAGRYWLRFHAVDYLGEVWVNGRCVGGHRGGETPFELDMTDAVKPGRKNMLAVRVLNPTDKPIDGLSLWNTAKAPKFQPVQPNSTYNVGGIAGSVELLVTPAIRVVGVRVEPDWKTGQIGVEVSVLNSGRKPVAGVVKLTVGPAGGNGGVIEERVLRTPVPPGECAGRTTLRVKAHRLWSPADPYLYRVTAEVRTEGTRSADQRTARCGFRDFRFENGCFRLNGKRIFLNGAMHIPEYPVGFVVPHDPDFARRDLVTMKALGFNFCRIAFGSLTPAQLDLCDELGLLVLQGHRGDWQLDWKIREWPGMEKEFARSIAEVVRRDRHHPSVVIWDWMNETLDGRLFRYTVSDLQFLRQLDAHRMVLLNSGRSDSAIGIGDLSNPGRWDWDGFVSDGHLYPPIPHTSGLSRALRTVPGKPFIITEYSECGALDVPRCLRHLEQLGEEHGDDAAFYREKLDQFMADWKRWRLDEIWARPEDFFDQSHRNVARLRLIGGNEVRANPNLVGHAMWNSLLDLEQGCGSMNIFREMKPENADVMLDLSAPLRWCLFAEPATVYRGQTVRLDAVLSNLDVLKPGNYPVRVQVVGPVMNRLLDDTITVRVPGPTGRRQPPFAFTAFSRELAADGPAGRYRFLVTFERGGAATGGDGEFHVFHPAEMPPVKPPVVLLGEDTELEAWLKAKGIAASRFDAQPPTGKRVILVSGKLAGNGGADALAQLAAQVADGGAAVLLTPESLSGLETWSNVKPIVGMDPNLFAAVQPRTGAIPLVGKGRLATMCEVGGYYRPDDWARRHPVFDGLPCGGICDYVVYREILPQEAFANLEQPAEAVAGAIRVSGGGLHTSYASGLHVSVHRFGGGRVILNTLKIRPNLGKDPVAERLLRNLVNHAAG